MIKFAVHKNIFFPVSKLCVKVSKIVLVCRTRALSQHNRINCMSAVKTNHVICNTDNVCIQKKGTCLYYSIIYVSNAIQVLLFHVESHAC